VVQAPGEANWFALPLIRTMAGVMGLQAQSEPSEE